MTTVTKKANKHVSDIVTAQVRLLCLDGNFPEAGYREERGGVAYSLFAYMSVFNATLRIAHRRLTNMGYQYGACENKRSDQFLSIVKSVVGNIPVDEISAEAKAKPFDF